MSDTQPTPSVDLPYEYEGVRYRWRLTREAVDELCHYCHWIPNNRGWTREMMERKYDGANFNHFLRVLQASKVRIMNDGLGAPMGGRCHWRVKYLYFTDATSFVIEWDDEVTEDDGRFFWTGSRDQEQTGTGAVVVKLTAEDYETPGRIREISESIAHELGGTD